MAITLVRATWLASALLLGIGSFAGGDTAGLCGWLLLAWTFPFGVLWWVYVYDFAQPLMETKSVQIAGTVLVIAVAYCFWLVLIPAVVRRRRPKATHFGNAL